MNQHPVRTVFNLIADLLTLLAIAIAGVGHMLPWARDYSDPFRHPMKEVRLNGGENGNDPDREKRLREAEKQRQARQTQLTQFQIWHASRSGIALGALAMFVGLSLAVNWSWTARRWLALLMFGCALTALLLEVTMMSPYQFTDAHRELAGTFREGDGFITSVVATGFALFFSLVRMVWTMPRTRPRVVPVLKPVDEEKEIGDFPEPKDYYAQKNSGGFMDPDKKSET